MRLKALAYGSSPLTRPQPYSIRAPPWKLPFYSSPTKPNSQILNACSSDISKRMFNTQHEFWWGHSDPRGTSVPDKRVGRTMGLGLSDPTREKLGEPGRKGKAPRLSLGGRNFSGAKETPNPMDKNLGLCQVPSQVHS